MSYFSYFSTILYDPTGDGTAKLATNILNRVRVRVNMKKEIIMLVHGGHGFKVLKNVEMIEVKQGPYNLIKDKIKFNKVDEKKIRIK